VSADRNGAMKKKILIGLAALALAGAAAFGALQIWRAQVVLRQEQRAFLRANEFLQAGRCADALTLFRSQAGHDSKLAWAEVELNALVGLRDLPRLTMIYERTPDRILSNEVASVLVSRAFLHTRRPQDMPRLRQPWQGREAHPELWLILDADALSIGGKPREAEKLLRSKTLPGVADADRLGRLAVLVAPRSLEEAWALLSQATLLNARNTDLRSFRGQILEGVGLRDTARVEYVAALVADPENPMLRDQLAEFYQRGGAFDLALDTWREGLATSTLDFPWLKVAFWGRVIQPAPLDGAKVPPGDLQSLAQWLIALPAGTYWDSNTFAQLPQATRYLKDRQELQWLQILDALQHRREKAVADLLQYDRFRARSWEPVLETALRRIIHYRQQRLLNPLDLPAPTGAAATNLHSFFLQLESLAKQERTAGKAEVPAEFAALLRGPDAFATAFLAAGWREAALQLRDPAAAAAPLPEWLAFGFAQALRLNRGNRAAADFLATQPAAPALELMVGEMLITEGQGQAGLDRLTPLAPLASDVGYRASYVLALADLDRRKFAEARKWIAQQPRLAQDLAGKELLARIAFVEGNTAEADRLYRAVAGESVEAKTYLARQAFTNKQWAEARRYTLELLKLLPDALQLRENLLTIDEAEARK
jgi:hypothetical protein